MARWITPLQIGRRLKSIRVENGFSQEDIAKILQIPRSSVVQMEKGNRQISAVELALLSESIGFSIDRFLGSNYEVSSGFAVVEEPEIESEITRMRDSKPVLKRAKLETVLLYITGQCGAKPNMDVNLLMYLLYFCDFNHYEIHEEQLTGTLYTKQTFGPSPEHVPGIIKEMEKAKILQRFKGTCSGKPCIKYLPGISADLMKISAAEKEVIDRVVEQFSDWPASALCDYSREDRPMRATNEGEPIADELVFYRRPPYSVRIYEADYD